MSELTPASWLVSAIDVIGTRNTEKPFKVLSTLRVDGRDHVSVLCRDTGAVWLFTCETERKPA